MNAATITALKATRASLEAGGFSHLFEDVTRHRCGCFVYHLPEQETPVEPMASRSFALHLIAEELENRFGKPDDGYGPFHPDYLAQHRIDKAIALEILDAAIAKAEA